MPTMPTTTILEGIKTIAACAAAGNPGEPSPIPGERPATRALTAAHVAAEAEPFIMLHNELRIYFNGDPEEALISDDADRAAYSATSIVTRHLAAAAARLVAPVPTVDWTDRYSLFDVASAAARRAADLRFVEILTELKLA